MDLQSFVPQRFTAADALASAPPDILCFSHLRWHFVVQRPQHLMSRFAKDRRVFFWEEPVWHERGELPPRMDGSLGMHLELLKEGGSVWIVRPHLTWGIDFEAGQRVLLAELLETFDVARYIAYFYTPMALGFCNVLSAEATVYDCMDELSHFLGAPPQLRQREQELFQAADVVFTGGYSLYEAKKRQHRNVHAFPSSIDQAHFAQGKALSGAAREPADQELIPGPRAGFYGVIDERLDLALIAAVARMRPSIHFVFLGPVVKIDPASLPSADNLHYLGPKSYDELPSYLAGWDTALLPFAINPATTFISPTKTPEYLAAGKTVVSTPIRDVVREYGDAGLVAIAGTAEAFVAAMDRALRPPSPQWREAVRRKLATTSWDQTWKAMQAEIDWVSERRSQTERRTARVAAQSLATPAECGGLLLPAVPVGPGEL